MSMDAVAPVRPRGRRSAALSALAVGFLGAVTILCQTSSAFVPSLSSPMPCSRRSVRVSGLVTRGAYGDDLSAFEGLSPDEWQDGVVQNIAPFGAFVRVTLPDGSEAEGLVHISQIRDGFVENVDDELQSGQEVKVRVMSVDASRGRISLSMKEGGGGGGGMRAPADLTPFEKISPEKWVTGKVARCANFGAFVTVTDPDSGAEADGLVHITQIKDGYVESVEDELSVGQEVQVRVLSVADGKMGLSMKEDGGDY
mmetsp:Transcript_16825/g.35124  ORF Transcript_16825/g.35124 Transcript_16825/m.35124 type:complete len:255 (-) Transcript_16825:94-858(-)